MKIITNSGSIRRNVNFVISNTILPVFLKLKLCEKIKYTVTITKVTIVGKDYICGHL